MTCKIDTLAYDPSPVQKYMILLDVKKAWYIILWGYHNFWRHEKDGRRERETQERWEEREGKGRRHEKDGRMEREKEGERVSGERER